MSQTKTDGGKLYYALAYRAYRAGRRSEAPDYLVAGIAARTAEAIRTAIDTGNAPRSTVYTVEGDEL